MRKIFYFKIVTEFYEKITRTSEELYMTDEIKKYFNKRDRK